MTLIVGWQRNGETLLLADTAVTTPSGSVSRAEFNPNGANKFGAFGPNINFVMAGNQDSALRFAAHIFTYLVSREHSGVETLDLLHREAASLGEDFDPFALLLQSNAGGQKSRLFELQLRKGLTELHEMAALFGSGNLTVHQDFQAIQGTLNAAEFSTMPLLNAGYHVVNHLNRWCLGEKYLESHKASFGGRFTFIHQDLTESTFQEPTLTFVLVPAGNRLIAHASWQAWVGPTLLVKDGPGNGIHLLVTNLFSNGVPEPDQTVLKREVREGAKRLQFTRIMLVPDEHRFDRPAWVFRVDENPLRLDAGSIGLGENVINALEEYRVLYGAESGTFLGLDEFGVLPEF